MISKGLTVGSIRSGWWTLISVLHHNSPHSQQPLTLDREVAKAKKLSMQNKWWRFFVKVILVVRGPTATAAALEGAEGGARGGRDEGRGHGYPAGELLSDGGINCSACSECICHSGGHQHVQIPTPYPTTLTLTVVLYR